MGFSRRELLTLLLGAPLAAQACKRPPPRRYAGSIRGGSNEVGHRLRDGKVGRPTGRPRRVEVAVVGAGASGLSAAWELQRQGVADFAVLDLEGQPGGTSAFGTDGVVPYPWAAHYLPLPSVENRDLVALLAEMKVIDVRAGGELLPRPKMLVREPEERVFYDDAWHEGLLPVELATLDDRSEFERFQREVDQWVAWRDSRGRRAFDLPRRRCSPDPEVTELDRLSAAEWLDRRGFRSSMLRWYVRYACQDDYGCALDTTSAWAMLFYFAARVSRPGEPSAPFLVWPEGNGRLVAHLANVAGERLKLRRLVSDVVPHPEHVELAVLDVASNSVERLLADRVILAVPKFVARHVFAPWRESPPAFLDAFTYAVWMTANLHLTRRPRSAGFPFAWDNVLYDSPSLGYVVATHQTLRDYGPTVWTYYLPRMAEPTIARTQLEAQDHASFCDAIVADLARAHEDLADCIERIDVWRWGHAMIRPTPGFLWGAARRAAAQPVGRVHFAHCDLSGLPLFEEAFDQGLRAAREVVAASHGLAHADWDRG
jgi:hypothetical protein